MAQSRALASIYRRAGIDFDASVWPQHAWYPRIRASLQELDRLLEPGEAFILVDEDQWGLEQEVSGHSWVPFPEREGEWGVPPETEAELISELRRAGAEGLRVIVFAWPAFWWLDEYEDFAIYLGRHSHRLLVNDHMRVFALTPPLP